jgi:metallo-beta-lactamase class B
MAVPPSIVVPPPAKPAGTSTAPPSLFVVPPVDAAAFAAPAAPGEVRGSLDKEIIRRVIRSHINEVKRCYEQELDQKPELGGRIEVQFTIAASGDVLASRLLSSTMGNALVERCVVSAVRGWVFPKLAAGGTLIASYPFTLTAERIHLVAGVEGAGSVEIDLVDAGIYVHRSTDAHAVPSNGLIVDTHEGLLLVDTAWSEAQTEAILRWGEEKEGRPWIGAVITHDHPDRDGGLGALLRRRIPVAALDLTVAKLDARVVHGVATRFTARAGEIQDPRGFEAFYPGPGHTSDNIVLAFRARTRGSAILFGGCLIKSVTAKDLGFTGDADLAAWPAAVGRVADRYGQSIVIPGHGPIDLEHAACTHTLELLGRPPPRKR